MTWFKVEKVTPCEYSTIEV